MEINWKVLFLLFILTAVTSSAATLWYINNYSEQSPDSKIFTATAAAKRAAASPAASAAATAAAHKFKPVAAAAAASMGVPVWLFEIFGDAATAAYTSLPDESLDDSDSEEIPPQSRPTKSYSVRNGCAQFGANPPEYSRPWMPEREEKRSANLAFSAFKELVVANGGSGGSLKRGARIGSKNYPVVYRDGVHTIVVDFSPPYTSYYPNAVHRSREEFEAACENLVAEKADLATRFGAHLIYLPDFNGDAEKIRKNLHTELSKYWDAVATAFSQ